MIGRILVWVGLTYVIGTRIFPESQTHATIGEVLRTTGCSASSNDLDDFRFRCRLADSRSALLRSSWSRRFEDHEKRSPLLEQEGTAVPSRDIAEGIL